MGSFATSFAWIILIGFTMAAEASNCTVKVEGCTRCDTTGTLCVKCRYVMDARTRTCVRGCGPGQKEGWSADKDAVGRVCVEAGVWAGLGLSGQGAAVVIGCLVGVALSMGALLAGVIYLRRRAHAQAFAHDDSSDSTLTVTPLNTQDRGDFLSWLNTLRKDAPTFLAMLNETRAQARRASSVQPYKPVLKDLLTLLLLLNTPEARVVTPPPDWRRLLAWAERVLKRYKRQSQITTAAVGELVSFLPYNSNTMSTTGSSTLHSRSNACSPDQRKWTGWNNNVRRTSILDMDDIEPTSSSPNPMRLNKFSFSDAELAAVWDASPPANALPLWSVSSKEIINEDDYGRLGFRPQDEITTEL